MQRCCTGIVLLSVCFLTVDNVKTGNDAEKTAGLLDKIIKEALESMRPALADLYISHNDFETGPQEFGDFKGYIENVTVKGLDQFNITILKTKGLNINNLTLVEEKFTAKGYYYLNGTLDFPLASNDIHLYGKGEMSAEFSNFSISLKLTLQYLDGKKVVKDLDILVNVKDMKVSLKNLMDEADLEEVFNQLINDVGLTVFNYYKKPILETIKPKIKKKIEEMLNPQTQFEDVHQEL